MNPLRIYVAGPITSKDGAVVKHNVEEARKVGEELLKKGHFPYVPHTHFDGWDVNIFEFYKAFQEHGLSIMEKWADAIFFIGSSNGADEELKLAKKLGLQVFTSLEQVPSE